MSIKEVSKRASGESLKGKNPPQLVVPESAIRNRRVQIVIDFMNTNLHRSIPLTELAGVANLSRSHLSYLFKCQTKLPPGEYLIRLKMETARQLLVTSLLSIKQIMAQVGYDHRSNFVRHFRRYFDLAPSEYRERAPNSHLAQTNRKIV
ncbi:MAG: AraC family transcriptional regulator [Acidobacteriota bacterium]